jgi:hypothetical protein
MVRLRGSGSPEGLRDGRGPIYHGTVVNGRFPSDIPLGKRQFDAGSTPSRARSHPAGQPFQRPAKSFWSSVATITDQVSVRPPAPVYGPTLPTLVEILTSRLASRS